MDAERDTEHLDPAAELDLLTGYLSHDRDNLLELGSLLMQADSGSIYPLDLLAFAAINRAIALNRGFEALVRNRNLLCASPIVRLMLDTAVRFFAASLVDDPHGLARQVLHGTSIRAIADRHGKKMRDAYLVEQLATQYPWVADIYNKACSFVHLSEKHIFSTLTDVDSAQRTAQLCLSGTHAGATDSDFVATVRIFRACQTVFVAMIESWRFAKSHPEESAALLAQQRMGRSQPAEPQSPPDA
jgi:hypothetical protein